MYEELVKRLRNRRICIQQLGTLDDYPLLVEAADAIEELIRENERGQWEMFTLLSSAFWGKQYYFMQDNGIVYSRDSGKYMTFDDAVDEFVNRIGDDGSI